MPERQGKATAFSVTRTVALALLLAACASENHAQSTAGAGPAGTLTGRRRWDLYLHQTYMNPLVPVGSAMGAGLAQWMDSPEEWGQGGGGYSRRLGHRLARSTIKGTYEHAGAALLGYDVRYFRARSGGTMARAGHAVVSSFYTYDRGGNRVLNVAGIGASFAAEYTAQQWKPERYRTHRQVVRGVAIDLGAGCATRLLREFSPDLRRLFHR